MSASKLNCSVLGALGLVVSLGAVACDDAFTSRTVLDGYRVVGVEASPPEVTPDDTVLLTVHDFYDGDEAIAYQWSLCVDGNEGAGDFACNHPEFQVDLGSDPTAMVDFGPSGLGLRALLAEVGVVTDADGSPRMLEQGFDLFARLESGPDCSDCNRITTVKRLRVRESNEPPNSNPEIRSFDVSGTVRAGGEVTLRVRTAPPETYRDPETGARVEEEYLYTWYTSSGETDPALTFGSEQETTVHLVAANDVTVMVAVRDGRGGVAVERMVLSP